jgi:hypothetical protein
MLPTIHGGIGMQVQLFSSGVGPSGAKVLFVMGSSCLWTGIECHPIKSVNNGQWKILPFRNFKKVNEC